MFCLQKLYQGVQDRAAPESPDHVMLQEVLLGGHLYLQLIKERFFGMLVSIQQLVGKKFKSDPEYKTLTQSELTSC